jgi:hypothetical protein
MSIKEKIGFDRAICHKQVSLYGIYKFLIPISNQISGEEKNDNLFIRMYCNQNMSRPFQ